LKQAILEIFLVLTKAACSRWTRRNGRSPKASAYWRQSAKKKARRRCRTGRERILANCICSAW